MPAATSASEFQRNRRQALICVDPDPSARQHYERFLGQRGYDLRCCADAAGFETACLEHAPQLVILEMALPDGSGPELIEALRASPGGADVCVIVVSADASEEGIAQGLGSGADDYLLKPVREAELTAKVAMLLKKQEFALLKQLGIPYGSLFNNRYDIRRSLGTGGFSTVYYALDTQAEIETPVALKVFTLSSADRQDPNFVRLFMREASLHSQLDHPNIVKLLDFGRFGAAYFLAMQYIEGRTLTRIFLRHGPLNETQAIHMGYQIALALRHLADKGLMHRDIKPRNIMITPGGDAVLLDFGLARNESEATISIKGEFMGTPQFCSPEYVLRKDDVDSRTDIYSLGATLFFAMTLEHAIAGETPVEILHNQLTKEPTPLDSVLPEVSEEFASIVDAMLEKDRSLRPSIDELIAELKALIDQGD